MKCNMFLIIIMSIFEPFKHLMQHVANNYLEYLKNSDQCTILFLHITACIINLHCNMCS